MSLTVCLFSFLPNYALAFYNPQTGHWLSRDPANETGGANLYGFLENKAFSQVDPNGEIGLDTALDTLTLAVDLSTGEGAATIALDVASLAISFQPTPIPVANPRAIRTINRIINGQKKTYELVDHALLSAVADEPNFKGIIWDDLASRPQRASIVLEYRGRRPNQVENVYDKHFKYFAGDPSAAKASTLTGKKDSMFAPGVDDNAVRTMVNEALGQYRASITPRTSARMPAGWAPHTTFNQLNGYVFDAGIPRGGTLGRSTIGYDHGECTTRIKLKLGKDGSIHAHPTIEPVSNPNRGWSPPTTHDDE